MNDNITMRLQPAISWSLIGAITACLSVFSLTLSLTYPLLALILERQGISETMIGLNAAMTPLGLLISAPLIPFGAQRLGAWGLAVACSVATLLLFILLASFRSLEAWFVIRLGLGIVIGGLFTISETWINQLSTREVRGRVMGFYSTVLSLGFAVGPFLLPLTGIEGWPPFLVGPACTALSLAVLLVVRRTAPAFEQESGVSLWTFLPLAPALLMAVIIIAIFDQATLSFLPLYGLHYGLSQATVAYALGVLIIGNVFLQFPIGWLADRLPRRSLLLACTLVALLGSLLLPLVMTRPVLLWPMLFIWGGVGFGIYTMALVELGDRFSGALLLAGNAAFALMWGIGGMIGPPLTGSAMTWLGPNGLPVTLALSFGLFAGLVVSRR